MLLQWSEADLQASIKIVQPSLDKLHFPTFKLPKGKIFTRLLLHPHSTTAFLLGEELWASYDMGATFVGIYQPTAGMVSAVAIPIKKSDLFQR